VIRVVTLHGQHFVGRDRAAVIRQMRDAAWMWGDPKRDYMASVADRVQGQTGFRIDTTIDGFIDDLKSIGYIVSEVQDN
jgi:hypothetical protein